MENRSTITGNGSSTISVAGRETVASPGTEGAATTIGWLERGEDAEWDRFVAAHPYGTVCQTSQWRDMIEASFPHIRAGALAIRDGATGSIRAGTMVYTVRSWLLGNRMVSVPFSSRVDPLVSRQEDLWTMMGFLNRQRHEAGIRSVQIRTLKAPLEDLPHDIMTVKNLKRHYLPLSAGADELFKTFHGSCIRRWIRKADKAGVTARRGQGAADWDTMFRIYGDTRQRLRLPVMPRRMFTAASQHLKPEHRELFITEHEGRAVGAGLFLIFNGVQQLEWVGDTPEGRTVGANQQLYWTAMQDAIARGCHTFCFGRTDDTNDGLLDYKRRWGSIEEDITILISGEGSGSAERRADTTVTRQLAQRIIDAAPRPLYLGFSEFCYRHLG